MSTDNDVREPPEDELLPDEQQVIAERLDDLDTLDEDEYLSVDELADQLGFDHD